MAEETRDRIVAAAYRTLSREGYERASIKDIAAEADVAPGLIHYYFDTKEDLLVATVRYACEQMQPPQNDERVPDPREAFETVKASLIEDRPFYQLLVRMISVALHNPRIAAEVREFIREQRAEVARVVHDVVVARGGAAATVPAISAALYGGLIGIAFQDLLEDEFAADAVIDALAWLTLGQPSPGTQDQPEREQT